MTPEKILKLYIAKGAYWCITAVLFGIKKFVMTAWHQQVRLKKYLVANFSKDLYGIMFLQQKWMNLEEYGTLQTLSEPKSI